MLLSKSKFIAGSQCLKRLYLSVHQPEVAAQPDDADQAIIDQGQEVGLLARQLGPGGIAVEARNREEAIRATRELVQNPEIPALFEGAFEDRGVFVRVDVLQRRRNRSWRLMEVKSTTAIREHHLQDVAIQFRAVKGSGLDVASASLAHINREYVHQNGAIDPHQFFKIHNVTRQVKKLQRNIAIQLRSEFRVLGMPTAPAILAGRQCAEPVVCEFFAFCNPPLADDHVLRLPRIHATTVAKLVELGVESIHDIPVDYPLTERLRRACNSVQTQKPWFGPGLKDVLGKLKYPLYFMDFETIYPAIPRFGRMRPYDHIPFQWSVQLQREPGAAPEHYEFLAEGISDPRPAFTSTLCDVLGDRGGSVVVYNAGFELQRLSELAGWLPVFSGRIKKIQRRLWDLLPLIRNSVYHPGFGGSYSLKSVLPALVPDMTYDTMQVADGQSAGLAWESLVRGELNRGEQERIRKALREYCGQDTLAMVRLIEALNRSATQAST
jgi:predicted RecB family nuclease